MNVGLTLLAASSLAAMISAEEGVSASADSCTALVLSGGGANGAWEAGVLYALYHGDNPEKYQYDVVTGVSAGAINTAAIVGWAPEEGVAMSEYVSYMWETLTTHDVWKKWPLGLVYGALRKPGALNDAPLFDFLQTALAAFPEGYKRRVTIGSVNVETGEYEKFTQKNTDFFDMPHAAVSSASIPFVFPPHHFPGRGIFMDGGTVWNVPIDEAIQQCLDVVDDMSKITVDVIICGGAPDAETPQRDKDSAIGNYMFSRDLHKYYNNGDAISEQIDAAPDVNYRYLFSQHENVLTGMKELDFNNSTTWPLQENGREVADATVAAGEGFMFKQLKELGELQADMPLEERTHWSKYLANFLNL